MMERPPDGFDKQSTPPFPLAKRKVRIAPSVLAADFVRLQEQIVQVESAGAEVLHLDVMDGHFVPNITFGIPIIKSLRLISELFFDAHLMIEEPLRYADAFVNAGCDHITFHIEVTKDPSGVVSYIREQGVSVGVAINPTTPVSDIRPILNRVDLVLVMSVWPGFGGQSFIADVLSKVRELHSFLRPDQRLEIDGGIDGATIGPAAQAGADLFVAGTAVFRQPDPAAAFRRLHRLAESDYKS